MQTKLFIAGIALLSLPLSLPAYAQGQGKNGQGSEKASEKGSEKSKSGERKGGAGQADRRSDKGPDKIRKSASSANKQVRADRKSDQRGDNGRAAILSRGQEGRENLRMRSFENGRYTRREPSFQGCPPGLAKKNNGCLPPGQARKLGGANGRGTGWLQYANWFGGNRGDDWRYDRGYAFRVDPATGLARSIMPLVGGALFSGNPWPQNYTDYKVSPYQERYFGSRQADGIRYADGAIFRVDPKTRMIGSIAGLLTGDDWNVGSPAPKGYELYNVPSAYRSQYADSGSNSYRYNDGYVYEIDPTTQLVRQVIELIV